MAKYFSQLLIAGLILGILVGQLLYDPSWNAGVPLADHRSSTLLSIFDFLGTRVFMGLLKMLILPVVAVSVLVAIGTVGDIRRLGRLGASALGYYFITMLIAVFCGVMLVSLIRPGDGYEGVAAPTEVSTVAKEVGAASVFNHIFSLLVPENIFRAFNEGNTLSVIVFFIFLGVALASLGEVSRPVFAFFDVLNQALMRMISVVLLLSPLGVFALIAYSVGTLGLQVFFQSLGLYMITVCLGLAVHSLIVLPSILYFLGGVRPLQFAKQVRPALVMAFGTSSSTATLPVSLKCAEEAGVKKEAGGLILPLGATINMDGTALYEAVAVIFLAQLAGITLGPVQLLLIALTATLAAVGAAGIPSAGLVTMYIVLDAVNNSLLAGSANATIIPLASVGIILGVDRFLDMFRTTVNVWGDLVGARLISKWFPNN